MQRYVAFLRGMNLGGRRITNDELCAQFVALGFENVTAFLASGNVIFDASGRDPAARIARGLEAGLGYAVPTFVRTADEVRAIAAHVPFDEIVEPHGKLQVAMLDGNPSNAARDEVLALATDDDRLALNGRELYWLPRGKLTDSVLDFKAIDQALGAMTMRTRTTVERIATKYLGD